MRNYRLFSVILLLITVHVSPVLALEPTIIDPEPTCSVAEGVNEYEIFRKGKEIGTHRVCFAKINGEFHVIAETKMKVKFLFITAYRYWYVSKEIYRDGELKSLKAYIDDNGKKWSTAAVRNAGGFHIETDEIENHITQELFTTNHWDKNVINHELLYNTLTGELNEVSINPYIVPEGENTITPRKLQYDDANIYNVRGELDINSIYGTDGNWLGMYFTHKDGSLIEFRCKDCRNTPPSIS
ncbi:DUF6134 family protein [Kordiimonas aquimaris]|uniref:DUF6134 family protein n=1 Tax=Kordiimonas aquimaris TaxID=707591 RepID=UPI0021D0736D|nr:DUF6134 family protein [Kordiimonas aquimaris]